MNKFNLSASFMLLVLFAASVPAVLFGVTVQSVIVAFGMVALSALFVSPGRSHKRSAFGQLGEVGDDLVNVEEQYKKTQASLKAVSDQLKANAEKSAKEIERYGQMQEETKAQIDKLLIKQAELQERLQDAEQKLQRGSGGDDVPQGQAPGTTFVSHLDKEGINLGDMASDRKMNVIVPISGRALRAAVTDASDSGGSLTYPADRLPLVTPLTRRLTIRDLLMPGRTTSSAIFFPRESGFTNNADIQSEQGALKAKSEIEFDNVTRTVVTIAHLLDIATQMLSDVAYLESYINNRMMYGLKLKEENQFLMGSGVGNNIEGLYTAATAYSQPAGAIVSNETQLDRLRLMILQAELADAMVTGIVMNTVNWANIELLKDSQNRYLFTNPQNTATGRLWGRDVVSTKAMTVNESLVGDFATHAQVLDREDANVAISFENKDNFERNLATLRVEERTVLAIYRPEAFVKGSLEIASE